MRRIPIFTALLLSLITIVLLSRLPADVWADWKPATCLAKGCFCESISSHGPIRQTANTVSSLAFVCSGTLVMLRPKKSSRMPRVYSVIMGLSIVIIGVGSAFYHASLTFVGQFFDVFGMFLLAAFMLVYAWERIWNLRCAVTLSLYLGLNLFLSWLQFAIPDTRRYAFAIVLIAALLFEYYFRLKTKPQIDVRPLSLGIGLLTLAYFIWILDNTRLVCLETSLLQGHAVWHILGAVSVFFLHRYYVSEGLK
jgi:dihydroceramidase